MTVYYTGRGDNGETSVMGKGRVKKDDPIVKAIGDIDELNSVVGVVIANTDDEKVNRNLRIIQDRLFVVGAEIASSLESGIKPKSSINENSVKELEKEIDELGKSLPELKKFVLPNGCVSSSYLHLARSVARRAERSAASLSKSNKVNPDILKYLNRLSSFFFAAALYMNKKNNIKETNPTYS